MAFYYDQPSQGKQISIFNETARKIIRIDRAWDRAATQREHGQLEKWKWTLDTVERELKHAAKKKLDQTQKTGYVKALEKINEEIIKTQIRKKRAEFYRKLNEKEDLLREIQEEAGMGTGWKGEDEDEMD